MSLEFKVLSHACLLIKSDDTSIIIDPWLLGSCYWRSWWNFPKAKFDVQEIEEVDAVLISHVHWDHWHGPTLRKYFSVSSKYVDLGEERSQYQAIQLTNRVGE